MEGRLLSTTARSLLAAASDVARFRGATECEWRDVVIAWLAIQPTDSGVSLYADAEASPSPDMLPFSTDIYTLLTTDGAEIGHTELIGTAAAACRDVLAELRTD